ncbi:Hypothetical protein A7982_04670 [Minicystis rosea]|nr:Hypothetical protein A7982_04670 [Minicystis rosea]
MDLSRTSILCALLAVAACGSGTETSGPGTGASSSSSASSSSAATGGASTSSSASSSGGGAGGALDAGPDAAPTVTGYVVSMSGYQVMVKPKYSDGTIGAGAPWDMKGIAWSPTGENEPFDGAGKSFAAHAAEDIPLMKAAHINTVRTYGPFERSDDGLAVLDALHAQGMKVAMTVFAAYDNTAAEEAVTKFKDHPAVLLWVVGNEWNYNKLYSNHSLDECVTKVNGVIAAIKAIDKDHPVAVGWGELPTAADMAKVPDADLWALNIYPYLGFGDRFTKWKAQTTKPFFVGEYGADAYDNKVNAEDQSAQAKALESLTLEIRKNLSAADAGNVCVGGCPYEWNDEWWKSGAPDKHDTAGFTNGGVYADGFANEEWWGIVTGNRTPRAAYAKLQMLYQ